MHGPQPMKSPRRWTLLQVMADSDTPLTADQLAGHVGLSSHAVRDLMRRPRIAKWVTITQPASEKGSWPNPAYQYEITDLGRRVLAEHAEEST